MDSGGLQRHLGFCRTMAGSSAGLVENATPALPRFFWYMIHFLSLRPASFQSDLSEECPFLLPQYFYIP